MNLKGIPVIESQPLVGDKAYPVPPTQPIIQIKELERDKVRWAAYQEWCAKEHAAGRKVKAFGEVRWSEKG